MWVSEIAGYGYFGGRGRGYPTPGNVDKKCYFSHISAKLKLIGQQKLWGPYPIPRGGIPLKIFLVLNSGWLDALTHTLPWLDLVVFRSLTAAPNFVPFPWDKAPLFSTPTTPSVSPSVYSFIRPSVRLSVTFVDQEQAWVNYIFNQLQLNYNYRQLL